MGRMGRTGRCDLFLLIISFNGGILRPYPVHVHYCEVGLQGSRIRLVLGCAVSVNLCEKYARGGEGHGNALSLHRRRYNGVSLFHRPFKELDRYRSGIIARRIDGRKPEGKELERGAAAAAVRYK